MQWKRSSVQIRYSVGSRWIRIWSLGQQYGKITGPLGSRRLLVLGVFFCAILKFVLVNIDLGRLMSGPCTWWKWSRNRATDCLMPFQVLFEFCFYTKVTILVNVLVPVYLKFMHCSFGIMYFLRLPRKYLWDFTQFIYYCLLEVLRDNENKTLRVLCPTLLHKN